jgi:hypothetical protein
MKYLKPRTIIIAGPIGVTLAVFVGHALARSLPTDLKVGMIAAAASVLTGLLFFGPLAWVIHWSEQTPSGDPDASLQHLRVRERYLSLVGMGAIGYLLGCTLTYAALNGPPSHRNVMGTVSICLAALSALAVYVAAGLKFAILMRLEILKSETQTSNTTRDR